MKELLHPTTLKEFTNELKKKLKDTNLILSLDDLSNKLPGAEIWGQIMSYNSIIQNTFVIPIKKIHSPNIEYKAEITVVVFPDQWCD